MSTSQLQVSNLTITLNFPNGIVFTTPANDFITGTSGINTVIYNGDLAQYSISNVASQIQVQDLVGGRDGTDTLVNIQRLRFEDRSVALDVYASFASNVAGNAGTVAKILGALFGAGSIQAHPDYVGTGLEFLDSGMSYAKLMQFALDTELGAGFSNEQEIQLLYANLLGHAPSAANLAYWAGAIASGQYTQVTLAQMAADTLENAANINLVGLAQTGIQYLTATQNV
jgi:serralysin